MPSLATTLSVLLAVFAGAAIVRFCYYAERRLRGAKSDTEFLDVLVPGDDVKYSDFVRIPRQLLRSDLQPFSPKLKFLYSLFVGTSAAFTYLGFHVVDRSTG
jgi:hypothetical protein